MYSFDVFDTLITRTTATPQGIFALIKDRITEEKCKNKLEDDIIENFFELRIHSEELIRKSRESQKVEEINLREIYVAMAVSGSLSEEQIDYLCCIEQQVEIANVVGIFENIQWIKQLLQQGERVVLISDMYLPTQTIRKMLVKVDNVFNNIPLYVSAEYRARKTTGNLYRKVQEQEEISYDDWIHIGDNMYQDIEIPFQLGIKVELYQREELFDFEKELMKYYGDDSRLQLMIGTAIHGEGKQVGNSKINYEKSDIAAHIGCRYAGPVLYSYAEWIVRQAEAKEIKRLYFIARDGYLIKKIVDIILSVKKTDIETYYIYGSRKAWRMPSLSEEYYNLYQIFLWSHNYRIRTLKDLSDILYIPESMLYEYLPGTYAKNKTNNWISNQELEYIIEKLSADQSFRACHLQVLNQERKLVQRYLEQEIEMDKDDFAFVDVGGGGLTQGCLYELMKERHPNPIRTFFFKIDRVNLAEGSATYTFMPGALRNDLIIEMMCRAPHGQTKGYIEKSGKIVPELEDTETRRLIEHGFYAYEKGILDFSKRMCRVSEENRKRIGSMRNLLFYLQHIAENPSKEVLEFFAAMPSSETGRETEDIEYAPRLTEHEIKEIFLRRTYEPFGFFYRGSYINYSVLRASESEKVLIEQCKREHGSILGRLYRQDDERRQKEMIRRYGKAAYYPIRLLDEKVVLYGAGKLGQDLYYRLKEDTEHEVVLWVDKKAEYCRQKGLIEVQDISEINCISDLQIVIAVMAEGMASEIRRELEDAGVSPDRMIWVKPYHYPNAFVEWKTENIG